VSIVHNLSCSLKPEQFIGTTFALLKSKLNRQPMKSFEELKPIAEGYLPELIAKDKNQSEIEFPFTEEGVRYEAKYVLNKGTNKWEPEFIKPFTTNVL
jgi:hypothetical protein